MSLCYFWEEDSVKSREGANAFFDIVGQLPRRPCDEPQEKTQ
jgi:hypothetical protein